MLIINTYVYINLRQRFVEEIENNFSVQAQILSNRLLVAVDKPCYSFDRLTTSKIIEPIIHLINGRVLIIDSSMTVIFDSFYVLNDKRLEIYETERSLKGESVSNIYQLENYGKAMYISVPITYADCIYGVVLISTSMEGVFESLDNVQNMLFVISLVTLILVTIISVFFASIISKPINELITAMKRTAKGVLNEKIEISTNDEIGQLAHAYNLMNTKLSYIEKQRKEFVANVSHELKTPLASIKILAESLIEDENANIAMHKEFLKDINSEMNRLNNMVDELLVLADLDEEKLALKFSRCTLNSVVDKVVTTISPLANVRNIKVTVEHKDRIQIVIDQGKIFQALMNIVHNAEKYTEKNGSIDIVIHCKNMHAVIEVQDNGIGIPSANLPYIFDRFYRVDSDRARKTGGTGIGLSIAHRIISLHQGVIEVNSDINRGTTFVIKLPIEPRQYSI